MLSARKNKLANDIESFTPNDDFFGFATTLLSSKRFLTATATSIGVLSIVDGFLRGYPDGTPIAFQPATRVAYGLLTIAICVIVISLVMHKRKRVMTVGMFILLSCSRAPHWCCMRPSPICRTSARYSPPRSMRCW